MIHPRMACLLVLLLAPVLSAMEFDIRTQSDRSVTLFEIDKAETGDIHRGGGGWPYQGITIGAYTGVFPVLIAFSQGIEVGIPIVPVLSAVIRAEGALGAVANGFMFDVGPRVALPLNEIASVNLDLTMRVGSVRYDIGLFNDEDDIGHATGWGPTSRAGIDIGGRNIRFFIDLAFAFFFFTAEDDRRISLPYLGVELGMRFYLG